MELKEKVVLVTGSSVGIGRETVLKCAAQGAKVVVTYFKDEAEAMTAAENCKKAGAAGVHVCKLNVTDDASIRMCVDDVVEMFGGIDVLVNNAGVLSWKPFAEQSFKEIEQQVRVNLEGLMKMTHAALPQVKGMIVNISSGLGKSAMAEVVPYCAAKFGVRGFTQALAKEVAFPVVSVNPGMTATRMTDFEGVPPERVAQVIVDAIAGKIKPDKLGDVDVWEYVK